MTMTTSMPPGACNAHCHVFGPRERFPYPADAAFVPAADAPKEALYALNDALGLQRCVVVQSGCHGFDNRATADAVAGRRPHYRGIALLPADVPETELQRLHTAGFVGVRFNYMGHLGRAAPVADVRRLAGRLAPLGWHLQLHGDPSVVLHQVAPALLGGPVPVVIDHLGRIDAAEGEAGADFRALCRLMRHPSCWLKLSGIDRISRAGPPYDDAVPLARTLAAEFGDRVLWGNDWPHPNHAGPLPDEVALVAALARIAPDAAARERLLVHNPARLYGFEAVA